MDEPEVIAALDERVHHVTFIGNPDLVESVIAAHMRIATDRDQDRDERREAWLSIATIAAKQATL